MPVFVGSQICWLCAGSGQITTGAAERLIKCGMCSGAGIADTAPATAPEMVDMLAAMPNLERHTLTEAEIDAAVAEYGRIIEAALREIEAEASEQ